MTIDINTRRCARRDVSLHVRFVVEVWNYDTSILVLLRHGLPVRNLGHGIGFDRVLVLVFRLEENHRPAICNLRLGNYGPNLGSVVVCRIHEVRVCRAQWPLDLGHPTREPAA